MKVNVNCPCCNEPLVIDVENISAVIDEEYSLDSKQQNILNELGIEFG